MKRKNYFCIFFILGFYFSADNCLGQVMFQKTYGKDSTDWFSTLAKTNDGGYIIAGNSTDYERGNVYILLVKTNADGDTLWTRTYGDTSSNCSVGSIQKTTDGGFILIGFVMNFTSGNGGIYLLKTDANFNSLWTKTYNGPTAMEASCVRQTNDGGYILSGNGSYNSLACVSLIRTNNVGDTLWTRAFADTANINLYGYFALPNADGSFLVTACGTGSRTVLLKIDSSGNLIWAKRYSGPTTILIEHTNDGNYVMCWSMIRPGFTDNDVALIKIDTSGNPLWMKTYGTLNHEYGAGIQQTNDGGFIISAQEFWADTSDVFLVKTDSNGNLLWAKAYGAINNDLAGNVFQTNDGGYILSGSSNSFGNGAMDFYLIKTDSNGNSGCHEWTPPFTMNNVTVMVSSGGIFPIDTVKSVTIMTIPVSNPPTQQTTLCYTVGIEEMNAGINSITIFPNPVTTEFRINTDGLKIKHVDIYDVLGNKVYENNFTETINVSNWSNGIYFVRVKSDEGIKSLKLLVQH